MTNESLENPKRGTPIRICNFIKQMQRFNKVVVFSNGNAPGFVKNFHPQPNVSFISKLLYFRNFIIRENIDWVITATDMAISLPVFLKILTGIKIAVDLHGLYAMEMYEQGHMSKLKSYLLQKKINYFLHFYDIIFTVSKKLKYYYKFLNKQIEVVYGGVTESEFYSGEVVAPEIFTIGYTGNAKPYQGIDALLKVVSKIKKDGSFPFRLNMIMSSGRGEIEDTLKKLDLFDSTDLNFKVSHEDVPALIAKSSVLVLARPSLHMTEYAYPSKLPEYLATGIPVVTTRVGPVNELFRDSGCMIIIEPETVEEGLEKALVKLQSMRKEDREAIGQKAIGFVRENLMWNLLGQKINKCLEKV